jgi:hypothetical protein
MTLEQKIQEEIDSQIRYGLRLTEFGKEQIRKRMMKEHEEYQLFLEGLKNRKPVEPRKTVSVFHKERFGDCEQRVYRGH